MGDRAMHGLELKRYAEQFSEGHIDLADRQARKLVEDLLQEIKLTQWEVKTAERTLDAVIRSNRYEIPDSVKRARARK